MDEESDTNSEIQRQAAQRLSYKFQRLRERIRAAIEAGELVGKLPGERSLARQFNVNAKTLSKALTDLAAEGVLERNVGSGTFVRDGTGTRSPVASSLLLLTDSPADDTLSDALRQRGLTVHSTRPDADLPPSLLARVDLVVVDTQKANQAAIRDAIVRGKPVVAIDYFTQPFGAHVLLTHAVRTAVRAAVSLASDGHGRIAMIAPPDSLIGPVADAVPHAVIRPMAVHDLPDAVRDGCTAAVCEFPVVVPTERVAAEAGITIPADLSLAVFGRVRGPYRWSGHVVTDDAIADSLIDVITGGLPHQPLMLWLGGEPVEGNTVRRLERTYY